MHGTMPTQIYERKMLGQTTDWTMAANIEDDFRCFAEKLHQCAERAEYVQPRRMVARVLEATKVLLEKRGIMKRDNSRNVEHSFPCRLIRRKLKDYGG